MPQPTAAQLGSAIRSLRKSRGNLSIEGLGAEAGIHWTSVSRIERGDQNLTWDSLCKLATALEIDLADLVKLAAEQQVSEP